jgi:predicted metalloprotease with PDZ domain
MKPYCVLLFAFFTLPIYGQKETGNEKSTALPMPQAHYSLEVDTSDFSAWKVELQLLNVPDSFDLGLYVHPEYDDRYYRYLEGLQVSNATNDAKITRKENTRWEVRTHGGAAIIKYRIRPPRTERQRGAWRSFVSPSGALAEGQHVFLFLVGHTGMPADLRLKLPVGWEVATALEKTKNKDLYYASSIEDLMDSPVLTGSLHSWSFEVGGIPHQVVYWPGSAAAKLEASGLVGDIQKLVEQTRQLFGGLPYPHFTFLLQDSTYGALEHGNSVTLGIPADRVADHKESYLLEIAHEFFHSWNLMRIRPAGYGAVDYKKGALSKELWWSEGLTMFYADLLMRRAGLLSPEQDRTEHLRELIAHYLNSPGNYRLSAEEVSKAAYGPPGYLGDLEGSTHVQGELIGAVLDILIRDHTHDRRSMDDVMRLMLTRFSKKGFKANDVAQLIREVSGMDVHAFFDQHITGNKEIDYNYFLALIGLRATVSWKMMMDDNKLLLPDLRIYAWQDADSSLHIGIPDPASCWAAAGLHTGDRLVSVNGKSVGLSEFYRLVRSPVIGDTVHIAVQQKDGRLYNAAVKLAGYRHPVVEIRPLAHQSDRQKQRLAAWLKG